MQIDSYRHITKYCDTVVLYFMLFCSANLLPSIMFPLLLYFILNCSADFMYTLLMHFMLFYSADHYLPTFIVFHDVLQSRSLNTCNCICIVLQSRSLNTHFYCISCCIAVLFITYPLLLYFVLYCSAVYNVPIVIVFPVVLQCRL